MGDWRFIMKSITTIRNAMFLLGCLALAGASAACSNADSGNAGTGSSTENPAGQSLEALLMGGDAGVGSGSGGGSCIACVQGSCDAQVGALKGELTSLRMEATDTFACVRDNRCFSLFFSDRDRDRDGGRASAQAAVKACLASCEMEAGLPSRESVTTTLDGLVSALDMCIDSSCASQCPEPARDRDDQ
jgi:hypothetical protein